VDEVDIERTNYCTFNIQQSIKQTWLSHDVATRKFALGLKQRLETESPGGLTTCRKSFKQFQKAVKTEQRKLTKLHDPESLNVQL